MTAFLFKFSTTLTQQNGAINRMLAEIRQGFNGLYPDFGGDLGDAIQAQLFSTPITTPIDVGDYSASTRPDDQGTMHTTYVWGEFGGVSTPGFWCDLICDLDGTTVDPVWFEQTLQQRWNRGNGVTRATTTEQQAVNGGVTEVEFVATGDAAISLWAPEFAKHGYAGVPNQPLSGTPVATTRRGPGNG